MEPNKNIHIVAFCGSLRRNSYNKGLLREAKNHLAENVKYTIADISNLPFYNEVIENSLPESLIKLRDLAASADAFVISTPEFNLSITAVLKNALEWLSRESFGRPLAGKPVTIMGASPIALGTSQAQSHLRDILFGLNVQLVNRPLVMVGNARTKFDEEGNVTDPATIQLIAQSIQELQKKIPVK